MTRIRHDLLGQRELPDHAYYGIHTLRALEVLAADALAQGRTVSDLAVAEGLISQAGLATILNPDNPVRVGAMAPAPEMTVGIHPTDRKRCP